MFLAKISTKVVHFHISVCNLHEIYLIYDTCTLNIMHNLALILIKLVKDTQKKDQKIPNIPADGSINLSIGTNAEYSLTHQCLGGVTLRLGTRGRDTRGRGSQVRTATSHNAVHCLHGHRHMLLLFVCACGRVEVNTHGSRHILPERCNSRIWNYNMFIYNSANNFISSTR